MTYTLEPIKVYFDFEAWKLLHAAVTASTLECSLIGIVSKKEDHFVVEKLYIPKQTRLAAYTKIVDEGIFELLEDSTIPSEKLKIWIHSHVNMGVSPSATDISQAKELMQDAEWFICGIWNKKAEYSLYLKFMGRDLPCVAIPRWADQALLDEVTTVLETQTVKTNPVSVHPYDNWAGKRHGAYNNFPYQRHSEAWRRAGLPDYDDEQYKLPFSNDISRAEKKKLEKQERKSSQKKPEDIGREPCPFLLEELSKMSLQASKISGTEFFKQSKHLCNSDYLMYLAAPMADTFEEFVVNSGTLIMSNDEKYMLNAVEQYSDYLQDQIRLYTTDEKFFTLLTEDAALVMFIDNDEAKPEVNQVAILDSNGIPQLRGII